MTLAWALALGLSPALGLEGWPRDVARGIHLVGLVLGLGAVFLVDWYGLVWLSGLRTFREVLRVGEAAHPVVWFGLVLLVGSGAFLEPDLASPTVWVKQLVVLALLNNGVFIRRLGARLTRLPPRLTVVADLPQGLRRQVVATLVISQAGWWVSSVIGYVASVRA